MSTWLIGAMGLVYAVVAVDQFMKGGVGQGIMFMGYAIGNIGLVIVAKQEAIWWWSAMIRRLKYQT